MLSFSK